MKSNILKLAKIVMHFAEIETDKGVLTYTGELAEGVEVFVEVEGEFQPAEDGEYKYEDMTITVKDGKVETIVKDEPEEDPEKKDEPAEESLSEEPLAGGYFERAELDEDTPNEDLDAKVKDLEAKIEELNQAIADKDAYIAELEDKLKKQEEELKMSAAKPAHKEIKESFVKEDPKNKALKYFQ